MGYIWFIRSAHFSGLRHSLWIQFETLTMAEDALMLSALYV